MAHELNPLQMGLLAAGAGFLDPQGGLMAGFDRGMQGYQNAIATNQHRQQMNDQQAVRQAFADFGQPDENGQVDPNTVFKKMMASGHPALVQFALANAPKRTVKSTLKVLDENGVPRHQVLFSDGTEGAMINAPAAERMAFEDFGGVKAGLNPFTGEVLRQFQKTQSPDAQASLAQSASQFAQRMAQDQSQFNQNFNLNAAKHMFDRELANRPQFKDGFFITPPTAANPQGTIMETPLSKAPVGSQMEKDKSRAKMDETLGSDTPQLIQQATGSGLGMARDFAGMLTGVTPPQAEALATLNTRAKTLAANAPRFEGPQSDADRQYYLEMVGDLGNPLKTVKQKMAAYKEVVRINKLVGQEGVIRESITPQSNGRKSAITPNMFSVEER
jgi:hypothetical protein